MNKLQINRMATTVLFAVLVFVSSVALAQKPIKRPPKKVRQTTTQQVAKPPKKTVAPAKPKTGQINGHEWVDLGLSVKWATKNVGADSPSDYGDYFAWGETEPKSEYTHGNCKTSGLYLPDISGKNQYDAARANWGGSWRIPSNAEYQEILDKCKWEWTKMGGRNGMKVISPNGNSIFLPAGGWCDGVKFGNVENAGFYWSSIPEEGGNESYSYHLYFNFNSDKLLSWYVRHFGRSIRPVTN